MAPGTSRRRWLGFTVLLFASSAVLGIYGGSEDEPQLNRRTAQALRVEFHELSGLDHRTGLSATDRVMAVVEPFVTAASGATMEVSS
jgi:hypothetical protein